MVYTDFWEYVLDPAFLAMTGLVLAPFLVLLYSVWATWVENDEKRDRRKK